MGMATTTTSADADELMTPGFTAFFLAFAGGGLMVLGVILWLFLGLFGLLVSAAGAALILGSPLIWVGLRLKAR